MIYISFKKKIFEYYADTEYIFIFHLKEKKK